MSLAFSSPLLGMCRGPILLCVDTSGSMRGAREVVAKALALECMRAAKAQVCLGCCLRHACAPLSCRLTAGLLKQGASSTPQCSGWIPAVPSCLWLHSRCAASSRVSRAIVDTLCFLGVPAVAFWSFQHMLSFVVSSCDQNAFWPAH